MLFGLIVDLISLGFGFETSDTSDLYSSASSNTSIRCFVR